MLNPYQHGELALQAAPTPAGPSAAAPHMQTLFTFPSARLTKHLPALHPPPRLNGRVEPDDLGDGPIRLGARGQVEIVSEESKDNDGKHDPQGMGSKEHVRGDQVLHDTLGPLLLYLLHTQSTHPALRHNPSAMEQALVLNVGGMVLPLKVLTGSPALDKKIAIYEGLGMGQKGRQGASLWWTDDDSGEAAQSGGRKAVWTLWLSGAQAPVAIHLRRLLYMYPAYHPLPVPHLPPFISQSIPHGVCPDSRFQPLSQTAQGDPCPNQDGPYPSLYVDVQSTATIRNGGGIEAGAKVDRLPPPVPNKPSMLKSGRWVPGRGAAKSKDQETSDDRALVTDIGDPSSEEATQPERTEEELLTAQPRPVRRSASRASHASSYRNSVVLVDNESGSIVGVLAESVLFDGDGVGGAGQESRGEDDDKKPSSEGLPTSSDETSLPVSFGLSGSRENGHVKTASTISDGSDCDYLDAFSGPGTEYATAESDRRSSIDTGLYFSAAEDTEEDEDEERKLRAFLDARKSVDLASLLSSARAGDYDDDDDAASVDTVRGAEGVATDGIGRSFSPRSRSGRVPSVGTLATDGGGTSQQLTPENLSRLEVREGQGSDFFLFGSRTHVQQASGTSGGSSRTVGKDGRTDAEREANNNVRSDVGRIHEFDPSLEDRVWAEHYASLHASDDALLVVDSTSVAVADWDVKEDGESDASSLVVTRSLINGLEMGDRSAGPSSRAGTVVRVAGRGNEDGARKRSAKDVVGAPLASASPVAEGQKRMQGGSVLLEFLAGGGLMASTIRSIPPTAVPALPSHFSLLGLSFLTPQVAVAERLLASTAWVGGAAGKAWGGLATWFFDLGSSWTLPSSLSSPSDSGARKDDAHEADDTDAEAEGDTDSEWEYAIPEFDPTSLDSTPRPIYRRKRPRPSLQTGFQTPGVRRDDDDEAAAVVAAADSRTSVIYFDANGIGRRAFFGAGARPGHHDDNDDGSGSGGGFVSWLAPRMMAGHLPAMGIAVTGASAVF